MKNIYKEMGNKVLFLPLILLCNSSDNIVFQLSQCYNNMFSLYLLCSMKQQTPDSQLKKVLFSFKFSFSDFLFNLPMCYFPNFPNKTMKIVKETKCRIEFNQILFPYDSFFHPSINCSFACRRETRSCLLNRILLLFIALFLAPSIFLNMLLLLFIIAKKIILQKFLQTKIFFFRQKKKKDFSSQRFILMKITKIKMWINSHSLSLFPSRFIKDYISFFNCS